jgi:hypothetical protein
MWEPHHDSRVAVQAPQNTMRPGCSMGYQSVRDEFRALFGASDNLYFDEIIHGVKNGRNDRHVRIDAIVNVTTQTAH